MAACVAASLAARDRKAGGGAPVCAAICLLKKSSVYKNFEVILCRHSISWFEKAGRRRITRPPARPAIFTAASWRVYACLYANTQEAEFRAAQSGPRTPDKRD